MTCQGALPAQLLDRRVPRVQKLLVAAEEAVAEAMVAEEPEVAAVVALLAAEAVAAVVVRSAPVGSLVEWAVAVVESKNAMG